MPRKGHIAKRTVDADAVYGSDLVTKFINSMMWQGKRSTAEGIFYEALTKLESKGGDQALKLFTKAVENAKPLLEVKTRRVGGANYQVPVEVNADRRTSLAIREHSKKLAVLELAKEFASHGTMPNWLEVDRDNYKGRVLSLPKREDIQLPVNEQLIVELYSK